MDSFRSAAVDPVRLGVSEACPFLGLENDSQSHYYGETSEHFCHRVDPPQPVRLSHQSSFCLNETYEECPVFLYYHRGLTPKETRTAFATGWGVALENGISGILGNRRILAIVLGVILIPIVFIAIGLGVSGIINSRSREQAGIVDPTTLTALPTFNEIIPSATPVPSPTPDTSVALAAVSSPTPSPSMTPTSTPTSTPTPTNTHTPQPVDCGMPYNYTFKVVEGPILIPEPGFEYRSGDIPPVVQASWKIVNSSSCTWESLALYSLSSFRTFAPLILVDGERIELSGNSPDESVGPDGEIELALNFSPEIARFVNSEFALVINGYRLLYEPYLTLNVQNWVTRISSTPTDSSNPGSDKSNATSEPDDRPVATPPSTRP